MLTANIECDELINQCICNITSRVWVVRYANNTTNNNIRKKDKRTLKKIMTRARLQENIHYSLEQEITYGEYDTALISFSAKIKAIKEATQCYDYNLFVGPLDHSNFRYASAVTLPYKGQRGEKCNYLIQLRNHAVYTCGAQVMHGYEADDALGIYQTEKTIAVHCDKDIFMIPGKHYNTMTGEITEVSQLGHIVLINGKVKGSGLAFFYYQLLVGDMTDNIPGLVKGKGPVWAYKLLCECTTEEEMLRTVINTYKIELKADEYLDRLLEQADLVWICRNREEKGRDYISRRIEDLGTYHE